jgi:predicted esterase
MTASGPEPTFGVLEGRVLTLFGAGKLDAALDATRHAASLFPERVAYTAFWSASIEGARGDREAALAALVGAVDARDDVWWGTELLRDDPDLQVLQTAPAFDDLVRECERRGAAAQAAARVEWQVHTASAPPEHAATVLFLHGRTGNLADLLDRWGPGAATAGVRGVAVQSSQMVAHGMYCWDDLAVAGRDIATAAREVAGDEAGVVLAGFSQGGGIAVRVALAGDLVAARGFVSVAPSFFRKGLTPDDVVAHAPRARRAGVRGWMAIGELDERYNSRAVEVARRLADAGFRLSWSVVAGVGHDYPEPFAEALKDALSYVLGSPPSEAAGGPADRGHE